MYDFYNSVFPNLNIERRGKTRPYTKGPHVKRLARLRKAKNKRAKQARKKQRK